MIGDAAQLAAEIDALAARAYSEIGVPAYLIGEDLGEETLEPATANDCELASTFLAMARTLGREPDAEMIAQLLELLADRYFLPSAQPSFSSCPAPHPTIS